MRDKDLLQALLRNEPINTLPVTTEQLEFSIILYMLSKFTLRISEILRLEFSQIVEPDLIIIRIAKTNEPYFIYDTDLINNIKSLPYGKRDKVFLTSYKRVYNFILKNYSPEVIRTPNHNRKVTHSYRYKNARRLHQLFKNQDYNKTLLHHKSKESQKYYLNKPK